MIVALDCWQMIAESASQRPEIDVALAACNQDRPLVALRLLTQITRRRRYVCLSDRR